jgi:hypothetical protein
MQENDNWGAGLGAGVAGITSALGYLQGVYNDPRQSTSIRMKAAIEALPYEKPRLAVTAIVDRADFAEMLDRAIERSGKGAEVREVKQIEAQPVRRREVTSR